MNASQQTAMCHLLTNIFTIVCGRMRRGKTSIAATFAAACVEAGETVLLITKSDKGARELLTQTVKVARNCQLSIEDYLVWNKAGSGEGIFEDWNLSDVLDAQASEPADHKPRDLPQILKKAVLEFLLQAEDHPRALRNVLLSALANPTFQNVILSTIAQCPTRDKPIKNLNTWINYSASISPDSPLYKITTSNTAKAWDAALQHIVSQSRAVYTTFPHIHDKCMAAYEPTVLIIEQGEKAHDHDVFAACGKFAKSLERVAIFGNLERNGPAARTGLRNHFREQWGLSTLKRLL